MQAVLHPHMQNKGVVAVSHKTGRQFYIKLDTGGIRKE